MDNLSSLKTLALVIAFVVPGLIARWAWRSIVVSATVDQKMEMLSSLVASAWCYVIMSPLLYLAYDAGLSTFWAARPMLSALAAFGVIFAWPVVAGVGAAKIAGNRTWNSITSAIGIRRPEPRAWDTFFASRQSGFVRVTFQDGGVIGGVFHTRSAVSCFPTPEDLFLESHYRLDPQTARFVEPVPRTMGVWVDMKSVKYVEFFELQPKESTDGKNTGERQSGTGANAGRGHEGNDAPIPEPSRPEGERQPVAALDLAAERPAGPLETHSP